MRHQSVRTHFMGHYIIVLMVLVSMCKTSVGACACGCGIFEVGTNSLFPVRVGRLVSVEYDTQDQNRNRQGTDPSEPEHNNDKRIVTHYVTLGYQEMIDRHWGFSLEVPYWSRSLTASDEETGATATAVHSAVGDMRVKGIYTGFSDDMSSGLTFGLKAPSGDYTYSRFDPDTQIGSGSTDLLLGAYHMGHVQGWPAWDWYVHAEGDQPVIHAQGYRPGTEFNVAAGIYYDGWSIGGIKVAPVGQVSGTYRGRDGGTLALSQGSGNRQLLLAPGFELDGSRWRIYADVGFPVYQAVHGQQLVSSRIFKLNLSIPF